MYLRLKLNLYFYILRQVNLFYDLQSKFRDKVLFAKETLNPFYNFPEYVYNSNSIIWTFTNLDKGLLPNSSN
jgi:hypothetical protein